MFVLQEKLVKVLLWSILLGASLGVVYDFFRIARLMLPRDNTAKRASKFLSKINTLLIFIEDVIYALVCASVFCVFIYYMNFGKVRALALVGGAVGLYTYYNTVGRVVMYFSKCIISFIEMVFRTVKKYTVDPMLKLLGLILRLTVVRFFWELYTVIAVRMCLVKADKGFRLTKKKKVKGYEESIKRVYKSGRAGVYSVLRGYDNSNAVRVQQSEGR